MEENVRKELDALNANGDIIAFGYGAKSIVNSVGVGYPPRIDGLEIGASVTGQLEFRDAQNLDHELTSRKARCRPPSRPRYP